MACEQLSLEGRVAVVTGGTSGIGRTLALGLARAGAKVAICLSSGSASFANGEVLVVGGGFLASGVNP